jgi:hypothetical protein
LLSDDEDLFSDELDVEILEERKEKLKSINICDVYWENRLVPESGVNNLPFFPKVSSRIDCSRGEEPIAENYRGRIKIYLFFDCKWGHISNNKLKLQVDPNLEEWLNDKRKSKGTYYKPAQLAANFKKWLSECYKNFDKEYKFDKRDLEREVRIRSHSSFFNQLTVGNSKIIKPDSILKFPLSSKKTADKIYGKIVCFEVIGGLAKEENFFYGVGKIVYIRMPVEVYGTKEEETTLSAIDFQKDVLDSQFVNELQAIRKSAPARIKVALHETEDSKAIILNGKTDGTGNFLNTLDEDKSIRKYYKIRIHIYDGNTSKDNKKGNFMCIKPGTKSKYKVQIKVGDVDFGITDQLWHVFEGVDTKKDFKGKQPTFDELKDCFYAAYGKKGGYITFGDCGEVDMQIDVLDPDNGRVMLPPWVITIKTPAPEAERVHSFKLKTVSHTDLVLGVRTPAEGSVDTERGR